MKIKHLISWSCLSLLTTTFAFQNSIQVQAHEHSVNQVIAQDSTAKSADLEAIAEEMITLFFDEEFDSFADAVSPKLKDSVAPEKMEKAYAEAIEGNGEFIEITETKQIETPTSNLVVVTLEFEQVTEDWVFIFNDDDQIIGLNSPLSASIEEIANQFIDAVIGEDYCTARGYFHRVLKETIFPQDIERSWENLVDKNGKFERIVNTRVRKGSTADGIDFVTVDLGFAKSEEEVLIIFDSSKNIVGVDFVEQ